MKAFKFNRIVAVVLLLLLGSTVAYAYTGSKYHLKSDLIKPRQNTTVQKEKNTDNKASVKDSESAIKDDKVTSKVVGKDNKVTIKDNKNTGKSKQAPSKSNWISTSPVNRPLSEILREKGIYGNIPNLRIVVDKSDNLLMLYSGSTFLKSYKVSLGEGGLGAKEIAGDRKTPEGSYYVSERSVLTPADKYLGSRWMRLSYPNSEDAERGLRTGLIDSNTYREIVDANQIKAIPPQHTPLGGGVGIHGGDKNGINTGNSWTWGCVALENPEVNEIYDYISVGTEVYIRL